jgi:hypothetical protein
MSFDLDPLELLVAALTALLLALSLAFPLTAAAIVGPRKDWNRAGLAMGLGLLLGVIGAGAVVVTGTDGAPALASLLALLLGLACAFVAAVLVVALEEDTGWAAAIGVVGCLLIGLAAPLQAVPVLEALSSSMLPVLAGTVLEAVALVLVVGFLVAGSARARALQIGIAFAGAAGAILVGAGAIGPAAAAAAGLTPRTTLIAVLVALVIGGLVGGVLETVRARRRSRRPVDG